MSADDTATSSPAVGDALVAALGFERAGSVDTKGSDVSSDVDLKPEIAEQPMTPAKGKGKGPRTFATTPEKKPDASSSSDDEATAASADADGAKSTDGASADTSSSDASSNGDTSGDLATATPSDADSSPDADADSDPSADAPEAATSTDTDTDTDADSNGNGSSPSAAGTATDDSAPERVPAVPALGTEPTDSGPIAAALSAGSNGSAGDAEPSDGPEAEATALDAEESDAETDADTDAVDTADADTDGTADAADAAEADTGSSADAEADNEVEADASSSTEGPSDNGNADSDAAKPKVDPLGAAAADPLPAVAAVTDEPKTTKLTKASPVSAKVDTTTKLDSSAKAEPSSAVTSKAESATGDAGSSSSTEAESKADSTPEVDTTTKLDSSTKADADSSTNDDAAAEVTPKPGTPPPPPTAKDQVPTNGAAATNVDALLADIDSSGVKPLQITGEVPVAEAAPTGETRPLPAQDAPEAAAATPLVTGFRRESSEGTSAGDDLLGRVGGIADRVPNLLDSGIFQRTRKVRARKVRRVVRHIDPWSVLTFSVLFHLCLYASLLLSSVLVWNAAVAAGTIENIEKLISDLGDFQSYEINGDAVFRAAMIIAGVLTLASTVLVVLLVVVFNLISDLVGGIRLTVVEEETVRVRRRRNQ
ncbi:MAG: DUF3566 domain-containing protein [Actinomycetota bacterium]